MLGDCKIVAFVGVRDADTASTFYRDTLGLRLLGEDQFALIFDVKGTMLRASLGAEVSPAKYTVLGWDVPDIASTAKQLIAGGVRFERYQFLDQDHLGIWTSPSGAQVAWFQDHDGNLLSITQF